MSQPFLGEIRIYPYGFAPFGWAMCNGQLLSITQNSALFSVIGTFYGGDGRTTFALPNLQTRVPIDQGSTPGLSVYVIGESGGSAAVTLTSNQLPGHAHNFHAFTGRGVTAHEIPAAGDALTASQGGSAYDPGAPNATLTPGSVGFAGGGAAHDNGMPTLCLNFCIALQGIFPTRN